jgi:hypothetical protein
MPESRVAAQTAEGGPEGEDFAPTQIPNHNVLLSHGGEPD